MKLYADTSALVKFFHSEAGTPIVSQLLENRENDIYISELAKIEFYCALNRRRRAGQVTDEQLQQAIDAFARQIKTWRVEKLGSAVIRAAEKLIKKFGAKHGLRTLDALHVATFQLISEKKWAFVSTDKHLNDIIVELGYTVMNPMEMGGQEQGKGNMEKGSRN